MSCRILLDENMSPTVAAILRDGGHDDLTVGEARLLSAPDEEILLLAAIEGRVLVTGDLRDFARLVVEWGAARQDFPGVVLMALKNPSSPSIVSLRIEQHITSDPARLRNSLTWLPPVS